MAINEKLIVQEAAAPATDADPNIMLDLNAGDVDSYDGDGDVWYDIHDFEFKPTTNVSEHFNTVTYTGNDGINEITGVGFQPDLVWIKRRNSSTYNHVIRDSVRGTDSVLSSNTSSAETVASNRFEFLTDGFKHLAGTQGANNSAGTYVAWCFKGGGAASLNEEGDIDSQVSVNNDLGFSVAKYIGDGSSTGTTIGHGLDTPPEMIIVKDLDDTSDWAVYSSVTGNTKKLLLNSSNAAATSGVWNNTSPTSSVFTVRYSQTNEVNHDFIAYSFTSKRGVSKVGSYIGNGSANNKIYTGFEPAFVMFKNTSLSNTRWIIMDNARDPNNPAYKVLSPNLNAAENTSSSYWLLDWERDGFRLKYGADNEFNRNGDTFIYYAVAKDTNETELADTVGFKPSIDPDDHFNTVTYTGTGTTNAITGVGFEPDLIWVKRRNSAANHYIVDTVRGNGTSTYKNLSSNTTDAEGTTTSSGITNSSIVDGGFTMQGTGARTNANGGTYVAWCFNVGGDEVTNTEGTINSTVRANNDLGFSIAKYTATGVTATVGHGLDTPPEMIIAKTTNQAYNWMVYHKDLGASNYLMLNSTNASASSSAFMNNTSPTSSVFTAGAGQNLNYANNDEIITYNFTSKRGVSKVGSFIGTGSSGNKIFTEFEPAFVMWKNADNSASNSMWFMFDNVRGESAYLMANSSSIEGTDASVQFHRDGFTVPNAGAINNSGQTHIYYAVAKNTNNEEPHLKLNLEADSYSGSGNWLDSSGNGNNGTINGATWEKELGNFFEFDSSNDYIDCGSASNIIPSGSNFTIETWVNAKNNTENEYWFVVGAVESSSPYGGFSIYNQHNTDNWGIALNKSGTWTSLDTGVSIQVNQWVHLVYTYDGSNMKFFVDGEEEFSSTQSGSLQYTGSPNFEIGRNISAYAPIKVGQVRLYSTALSQAQIRQNFNFTKPKYPNEFHGDINGATWNASGYFDFDGSNDFVDLDTSIGSTFWANNWSASSWVYFDSTSAANQAIFTSHGLAYNYLITNNNTQLRYSNNIGVDFSTSSGVVSAGQWHHIVITRSSENGTVIYVDKVSVGTDSSSSNAGTSNASGAKPQIGAYTSTGSYPNQYPLDGRVSKFKLYNKALTQSEVDALYNEGE